MDTPQNNAPPRSLSIVMPVYNECAWLRRVVDRVEAVELPNGMSRQIVIVDDGSTDGTAEELARLEAERPHVRGCYLQRNGGKGGALRAGFEQAHGDLVVIQDADLEYDPADYAALIRPVLDHGADVVIGSRYLGASRHVPRYWHSLANRMLTTLSNMLTNLNLTDMECCYKLFRRPVLDQLRLREDRFGIEPELVAKVARLGVRIWEVPVSYAGRTQAEGKKITWRDGLDAVRCIVRYNLMG